MKDNEKNLNNALSDEAVESVAGGAEKDWGFFQKRKLKSWMKKNGLSGDELEKKFRICINEFSPETLKAQARRKGHLDADLDKILS